MKKAILTIAIAAALIGVCKAQLPESLQQLFDVKQEEYTDKASEDMKAAFKQQLEEFITGSELSDSLGITAQQQEKIKASLQDYLAQYELDGAELSKAQDALRDLVAQAKELDAQTIEDRLQDILGQ